MKQTFFSLDQNEFTSIPSSILMLTGSTVMEINKTGDHLQLKTVYIYIMKNITVKT